MATKKIAMMNHTPEIEAYLRSVRKYPVISADEERALLIEYQTANETRKNEIERRFANANQLFIFSKAKEYTKDDSKVLDYVNEGSIGIMKAVSKFDVSTKFRFITFAKWYIMQAMTNYAQTTDKFLRKTNGQKIGNKILKIKAAFFQDEHRDPTADEIKEKLLEMGVKIKDIKDLDDVIYNSIDSVWGDDDATFETNPRFVQHTSVDNEYDAEVEAEDNANTVNKLLKTLDERSQLVIRQLFGIGYESPIDPEVVAEHLGLTTTRVGQIKKAALKKMAMMAK